ncbi:MAG: type II toxin-antitoxin system VapC family toxin [Chloroflexi bacterium]|nr:type II toxin-antitoxin system VapC family toxin [Chloroflexota bacterium]
MGSLVLDAGVLIGLLDADDPYHQISRGRLVQAGESGDSFLLPVVAYAEVLTGALAAGRGADRRLAAAISTLRVSIEPVDEAVASAAAQIRAAQLRQRGARRWRIADALVVATAVVHDADVVITTDTRWPPLDTSRPVIEVLRLAA